jgi:hypothetical protein
MFSITPELHLQYAFRWPMCIAVGRRFAGTSVEAGEAQMFEVDLQCPKLNTAAPMDGVMDSRAEFSEDLFDSPG